MIVRPGNAYGFLMLAQRRVYHPAVEQDLGRVGDVVERPQSFVELVVVVVAQRFHPCLDLLPQNHRISIEDIAFAGWGVYLFERH